MFKSSVIYFFLSKYIKVFYWFSKSKFLNFMATVNPNNGNEKKSDIFPRAIFKSDIILIGMKILNYSIDFYNWHASVSLQKWYQVSKMKQNQTWYLQVCKHFSLSRKASLYYLNDFWNLSVEKIFLKNEW